MLVNIHFTDVVYDNLFTDPLFSLQSPLSAQKKQQRLCTGYVYDKKVDTKVKNVLITFVNWLAYKTSSCFKNVRIYNQADHPCLCFISDLATMAQ